MNVKISDVVNKVMNDFGNKKKVFFNEAHFQYEFILALYSELGSKDWQYEIEYQKSSRWKIDLVLSSRSDNNEKYAFEFKYKVKSQLVDIMPGLQINLKDQIAHDESRYNCWRDIYRIEQLIEENDFIGGFFLLITNDEKLISKVNQNNQDYKFDISEGEQPKYAPPLVWKDMNRSTAKKHSQELSIKGKYTFKYNQYGKPIDNFNYLIVPIE